jgi:serine/threonine protein phosphatase 1
MARFVIGDVHGFQSQLQLLLNQFTFTKDDTLIFLGDYVDKGPDVSGTLEFLSTLKLGCEIIFLRGNHDQSFLKACRDPAAISLWECLAGDSPLTSYGIGVTESVLQTIPPHHLRFLEETCQNFHQDEDFIYVHGGIQSHLDPGEESTERLHWSTLSQAVPHLSGKTVIFGHSAQKSGRVADLGHTICVDTGITSGGFLTCLNLDTREFVQVSDEERINRGQLTEPH